MRITITHVAVHRCFVLLVIVLSIGGVLLPLSSAAPLQQLFIEVYDNETSNALQSNTVVEGKSYDVAIGTTDDIGFVVNVTIIVSYDPVPYITSNESPFITIQAPSWNAYRSFVINASKEGYQSIEQVFTVIKGGLTINMDKSVDEEKEFQVIVRDQEDQPVEDALVFVDPGGSPALTDAQGIAYLTAPEVPHNRDITVKTTKDGYINASAVILVQSVGALPMIGNDLLMQLAPILFAVVAVVFAVFYVRWRKRTPKDLSSQQTKSGAPPPDDSEKTMSTHERPPVDDQPSYRIRERVTSKSSSSSSKVEEIRIPLQEKRRETTVLSMETPKEKPSPAPQKDENEWFKGQEYMRYKLDEMTGSNDRKNEGKWFEGERNIESKVDEALKKQSKRKKVESQEQEIR